MHPTFVKLFIETDADDLLAEEEARRRRAPVPAQSIGQVVKPVSRDRNFRPRRWR